MASIEQVKIVEAGDWRTLESGWNASFSCMFQDPAGAQVKVRYGDGAWRGYDSEKQTLDGANNKTVHVGSGPSLLGARVQMKVQRDTQVFYTYIAT